MTDYSIKICPDAFSFSSVGGIKENSFAIPDTEIYRSAEDENAVYCYAAQTSRTNLNGWIRFKSSTTTPTLVNITTWDCTWKGATGTLPVLSRLDVGEYTITYPSTVNDEQGNVYTTNLKLAMAQLEGSTPGFCQASVTSPNIITVYLFSAAGSASDFSSNANITVIFR